MFELPVVWSRLSAGRISFGFARLATLVLLDSVY